MTDPDSVTPDTTQPSVPPQAQGPMPQPQQVPPTGPGAPAGPPMGQPVGPYPGVPMVPYPVKPKKTYPMTVSQGVFALAVLVVCYLFWAWVCPRSSEHYDDTMMLSPMYIPGVAVPVFFALVLGLSMVYFKLNGVKITAVGVGGAVLIMIGALPFAFFSYLPFFFLLFCMDLIGLVLWYGLMARTLVATRPDADLVADVINQGLCVPFRNFGAWFAAIGAFSKKKGANRVVIGIVGFLIAIPIMIVVISLLASADQGFSSLIDRIGEALKNIHLWSFTWRLILAVPVAMYAFALMWGNAHRIGTDSVTRDGLGAAARAARKVHLVAVATPLAALSVIYIVFFGAMGSYLFSAFSGSLPGGFTYADYARRGFFELAAVATINFVVIAFTYLFTARGEAYPRTLRIFGAVLSILTILLIATSVSKMVLYISAYGLTRLRLYTLVAMIALGLVFILLTIWHIHPFRVSGAILIIAVVGLLGMSWANTDGIIAQYNVDLYLNGKMTSVDVDYIAYDLNEAAVPALIDLRDHAPNGSMSSMAQTALNSTSVYQVPRSAWDFVPWTAWNLQSHVAQEEVGR